MKMKKMSILSLALALTLLLTACGGANSASYDTAENAVTYSSSSSSSAQSAPYEAGDGWTGGAAAEMDSAKEMELAADDASSPLANAKIIYTADMTLETKAFDDASQALDGIVESLGGYYESRSLYQGGSYRRLNCTIRIPAENFNAFLAQAGQIANVTSQNEYKDDISEVYYDNEARLITQQTKLERLLALLEQAATMEDIISLENAISETELQIEYLTGTLRKYDSLVGFSTITLYLNEVYRLSTEEAAPLTFGQRLGNALSTGLERGVDGIEDFIISIARNWMSLMILGAILALAVTVLVRHRRRRRKSPPTVPPQEPPKNP